MFSSFQSFRRPTVSKWIISPGRYHNRDLLRGGWLDGEKYLAQLPALLDVRYGTGRIAMIGFRAAGAVSVPARGSVTSR